jgi:HK97 family phage major capsid protein
VANLTDLREEYVEASNELAEVLAQAGPDKDFSLVTRLEGSEDEKQTWCNDQDKRLLELGRKIDALENLNRLEQINEDRRDRLPPPGARPPMPTNNGNGLARYQPQKSLAQILAGHKGLAEMRTRQRGGASFDLDVAELKTLVTLTNMTPQAQRVGAVDFAVQRITVADLPLQGTTTRNTIDYYEQTGETNAADVVAEGGTKPESALAWTLRSETIRKIATHLPATDEVLDDNPGLEALISGRLRYMVEWKEEQEILSGNGTGQHLLGFLSRGSGGLQNVTKAAGENNADAIFRAMQAVRGAAGTAGVGFAEPTAVVMHPQNWSAIVLLKATDGPYIWTHPSTVGPATLWGKPVILTTAITLGTALVGAFRPHSEVFRRRGVTVTLSSEHGTNFVENKVTILAESRLTLAVYQASAFCTATSLVAA